MGIYRNKVKPPYIITWLIKQWTCMCVHVPHKRIFLGPLYIVKTLVNFGLKLSS